MQAHSFRFHVALIRGNNLIPVVHDRDAHADVLKVSDSVESPERVVMHCFPEDANFACECMNRGFRLSYPGVMTFGSAGSLRETARVTPLERILVETDAPYPIPKPRRGKPNALYLLPHTVTFLADLLGIDLASSCHRVTANIEVVYATRWDGDA